MRSAEADRDGVAERPHSPFEALLAVSGNVQTNLPETRGFLVKSLPSQPSRHSAFSQDGGTVQRLQDPLAEQTTGHCTTALAKNDMAWEQAEVQECRPEGVGTSGGGESGDTDSSSGLSKEPQAEEYPREEGSEVHLSGRSVSWGARSPRRDRRRQRMVWTPELHERFLNAVNHLGMKNAVPKTILRMMNVEGMTRENVASHLQKYRLHLKRQADGEASGRQQSPARAARRAPHVAQGLPVASYTQPATEKPPAGTPALGLPVCRGVAAFAPLPSSLPIATSYIPPQAWAAGVPGYDALQAIQKLASQPASCDLPHSGLQQSYAAPPTGLQQGGVPGAGGLPAMESWEAPLLDIAPLSTMPPTSAAAT